MSLFFNNHQYDDAGEAECPWPGHEDDMIGTEDEDGTPAWWSGGHLYVLNKLASFFENNPLTNWAHKQ